MYMAWGDESGSCRTSDPGTYVMAAAMSEIEGIDELRSRMRNLLLRGQRKVHWHDESPSRRLKLVDAIADMTVEGFVVVRVGGQEDRGERQRRKCLELLLCEISGFGCDHLVLESRGATDDSRDRKMMEYMRRGKKLVSPLRLSHEPGPRDPMLWIPDILCGAIVQGRTGDPTYLERIASRTTVRMIETCS
jgi:hypothetical protein